LSVVSLAFFFIGCWGCRSALDALTTFLAEFLATLLVEFLFALLAVLLLIVLAASDTLTGSRRFLIISWISFVCHFFTHPFSLVIMGTACGIAVLLPAFIKCLPLPR
jgi:hypothetical protein